MKLSQITIYCQTLRHRLLGLIAASMVLTISGIYLFSKISITFNSTHPTNWLAKIISDQPIKVDTTVSTPLNTVIPGRGKTRTTGSTPLNTVIPGRGETRTTRRLENNLNFSLTGNASSSDDAPVLELDAQFQNVNDKDVWVYSAHYDDFNETAPVLRILGIGKIEQDNIGIFCQVTEQGKRAIVQGKQENLRNGFDKNDSVAIFSCGLREKSKPSSVSLTFNITDEPNNKLRVIYPKPLQRNFTVCHAALFNFNNPRQIINSFEINRVLGAQHFYVYNHSVSNATDAVLRHYQELGLLTVMPWRLPASGVWYKGQILAINDCVYRNRQASKFVVIHDTDEYIIPKVHDSWAEVLRAAEDDYFKDGTKARNIKTVGSFLFQSSFYYNSSDKLWASIKRNASMTADEEAFLTKNTVFPFIHTLRGGQIYRVLERSKAIVRPEWVIQASIHYINVHRKLAGAAVVSRSLAVLQHHRRFPNTNITEVSALRFMKTALPGLRAAYNSMSLA